MLSGTVPQISIICGPCAGGAAYSPALTDFIIQTRNAQMFITGPQVIKQVTGEAVTAEELGGPQAQMNTSGVVHLVAANDEEALYLCRSCSAFCLRTIWKIRRTSRHSAGGRSGVEATCAGRKQDWLRYAGIIARVLDNRIFWRFSLASRPTLWWGSGGFRGARWGLSEINPRCWPEPGYQCFRQVGAIHSFLQCLQCAVGYLCGCPGFPARGAAGVRRNHSSTEPRCCLPTRRRPCRK